MESRLDLNLLAAFDALLTERGVTGAAERLHTSAPAMSRTLGRLRRVLDDPVLVRAGRGMAPTPRALAMHAEVRSVLDQARSLLVRAHSPDPATMTGSVSVQANELLLGAFGPRLTAMVRAEAPGLTLYFLPESHEDTNGLRNGVVDLEVGQIQHAEPENHIEPLLTDSIVGVARNGHPFTGAPLSLHALAAAEHVVVSRRGRLRGPVDELLAEHGLHRRIVACTPTVPSALRLLPDSDLVGMVPRYLARGWVSTLDLHTFELPIELPPLHIGMAWHPRNQSDGVHAWLRGRIQSIVASGPA